MISDTLATTTADDSARNWLERAEERALQLAQIVAVLGVVGMLTVGVLTTIDVVFMRTLLNAPIPGTNEVLATLFAVATAAVLPCGVAYREILEIDLLEKAFSATAIRWLRAFSSLLFLIVLCILAWRLGIYAHESLQRGQGTLTLRWPLWPFFSAIALLVTACVPIQFIVFLASIRRLVDRAGVARTASRRARVPQDSRQLLFPAMKLIAVALGLLLAGVYLVNVGGSAPSRNWPLLAGIVFSLLWVAVLLFVNVGTALAVAGLAGTAVVLGTKASFDVFASTTADLLSSPDMAVIPLFLLMGSFATIGGMSAAIYRLAQLLLGGRRAGLAHATIAGCAGFGCLTGSSIATVVTIGRSSVPEMLQRGYAPQLATGTIAAGGTLGQLIPPSTAIVLFALLTEQSIGSLYIAIMGPALLTIVMYMAAVAIWIRVKPDVAPAVLQKASWTETRLALLGCTDAFIMLGAVLGGMLFGVFTATEAAAVGAAIAFVSAVIRGKVTRDTLWIVIGETTRSTAMIYFVLIGAMIFSFFIGITGLSDVVVSSLGNSGLSPLAIISVIVVGYIILGSFMDGMTITILTASITTTIVTGLGYSPIWWGVMIVVLIELGAVTPPFGINLFVMKSVAPSVSLTTVYLGCLPFITADLIKIVLLLLFPAIALWLPSVMATY